MKHKIASGVLIKKVADILRTLSLMRLFLAAHGESDWDVEKWKREADMSRRRRTHVWDLRANMLCFFSKSKIRCVGEKEKEQQREWITEACFFFLAERGFGITSILLMWFPKTNRMLPCQYVFFYIWNIFVEFKLFFNFYKLGRDRF